MPAASQPRRIRWQFSLRALLFVMALVGVGLTIFRWPWEEKLEYGAGSHHGGFSGTVQYRRGWNGKPLKHGLVKGTESPQPNTVERIFYDDGLQRERRFEPSGKLMGDCLYRDGVLHGPYFSEWAGIRHVGSYRAGEMHGKWQTVFEEEKYTVDEEFLAGKRQGRKTWTSLSGRLLQAAEYDHGRLVAWNERSVAEELRRWLSANCSDPEMRRNLLETEPAPNQPDGIRLPYGEMLYFVGKPQRPLVIHWNSLFANVNSAWEGRSFSESLLDFALTFNCTFSFRHGLLHIVRINEAEIDWQDQTGVNDVQFTAGSAQEMNWFGLAESPPDLEKHPAELLRRLFARAGGSPIEVDTTAIDVLEPPFTETSSDSTEEALTSIPRIRRDLVGQHLNRAGYYCQQQGNTLIIKPHADRPRSP